jgi:TonB-linked SusC/RagA family outer membrane protein
MKLNPSVIPNVRNSYFSSTFFLIMRISSIALLALLVHVAFAANSQSVSLSEKSASLHAVIEKVKKQTGYNFFYVKEDMETAQPVTIELKNSGIKEALNSIFINQPLTYVIENNTVVIKKKEAVPAPVIAQAIIKGKVLDENGKALANVSVMIKGTTTGATTNENGEFSINLKRGDVLVFSYIGYDSKEQVYTEQTTFDVVLKKKDSNLSDIVVIGYGSVSRKNITGAVGNVKAADLNLSASTNVAQALAGRAAGVAVIQSSGQPGASVSISIRSNPSYASAGALYVVDGVIVNDNAGEASASTRYGGSGVDRSPLNFINPNDIESIDFLKDASATAIYGARAGGGVVLITTKKGKGGKPTINYDGSFSAQKAFNFYSVLGTKEYMQQRNKILYEKYLFDKKIAPYGTTDPSTVPAFVPKYSDAQIAAQPVMPDAVDAITRNGFTQQHNLSVSGTSNRTRYFTSVNYLDQNGVLIHSDYKRYNGRLNLEQGVGEKIKLGTNVIVSGSNATNANVGTSANEYAGMITSAFYYPATMPLQDSAGNYPINPDYQNAPNPLSFREITDYSINSRVLASGYAEWKIIPTLSAKANFSWDQSVSTRNSYLPKTFLYGARAGGQASINEDKAQSKLAEYTLNYDKTFLDLGHISVVAGHSYQVSDWSGTSMYNDHFPTDNFTFNNMGLGAAPRPGVGSYQNPSRIWKSYFGRVIWEFNSKYILSASIRRDGASNFAENKKWGTFPGVSLGWVMSEENFLKNSSFVNFLKLRVGYGTTGNSSIGGSAFAYYGSNSSNSYVFGSSKANGVSLTQLNNDNLTWETQKDINAGIDFQLLKNRIGGSFDYYVRTISNLLSSVPLSSSFPVSSVATNSGTTRSRGWEFNISSKNIVSKNPGDFSWNTAFNLSHYYNYWVERSPDAMKSLPKYIDPKGPFNGIYGYLSDGIYQGGHAITSMPGAIPGGIIIKDLNGYDSKGNLTGKPDGQISSADQVLLGISGPRYSYGFNNTFAYKGFDLSVYMYGFIQKKYNSDYSNAFSTWGQLGQFGWNVLSVAKERWSYDNTSAKYPTGLSDPYSTYSGNSNYWLENGNFIRVRDITLGYTISPKALHFQHVISAFRVYATGQNLFVITKYKGMDPELQNYMAYPMTRTYTVGVNVSF